MVALAVLVALAAALFSFGTRPSFTLAGGALVTVIALVLAMTTSLVSVPRNYFQAPHVQISEKWTPLSRVLGYKFGAGKGDAGAIVYDQAWAPVPAVVDGKLPDWKALSLGPQSAGFALRRGGRALIIGGGGGRDIDNALSSGIADVDVIELNSAIRDIVDNQLGSFSGSPYTMPHVHTAIGDGRAVLARRSTKYDEIHIGFTDTLSADSAQGFALTEANLYTREAFGEYLDHLDPNGILERHAPSPPRRTRGNSGHGVGVGFPPAPRCNASGTQRRSARRARHPRWRVRDDARPAAAVDRSRARGNSRPSRSNARTGSCSRRTVRM